MRERHICCTVWLRYRDGNVQRGCPHCWKITATHPEGDADLARRLVDGSIRGHESACRIPVRWAPVTSTPVGTAQSGRQVVVDGRAARLRARKR